MTSRRHRIVVGLVVVGLVLGGVVAYVVLRPSGTPEVRSTTCTMQGMNGPAARPAGAVLVPAGSNHGQLAVGTVGELPPNTTYYFAAGVHSIGTKPASQIAAGSGDVFVGAPGAVLDGGGVNHFAFVGGQHHASNVRIEYLTIENFAPPGQQGAVGEDATSGWTVDHDTVRDNFPGAGIVIGTNGTISHDCLEYNGQYGFQAYAAYDRSTLTGGPSNVTVTDTVIRDNSECNWGRSRHFPIKPPPACHYPMRGSMPGCGCSGGAKFWKVDGATVRGNVVADNYGAGLWADTNDDGFVVEDNVFSHNWGIGWIYEVSYNLLLEDNSFVDNAWGVGPYSRAFPEPAVFISNSGGDASVPNRGGITTITIAGNTFANNWSGVVLWANADRFCGSTADPTDGCTLGDPTVANRQTCSKPVLGSLADPAGSNLYGLCQWRTANVIVRGNTFDLDISSIPRCEGVKNSCGMNGILANYGSEPKWSPYKGAAVGSALLATDGNIFEANRYAGAWQFDYGALKSDLSASQWRAHGEDTTSAFAS